MSERIDEELELLRSAFPDLEYHQDGLWVRLPQYPLPPDLWQLEACEACFQMTTSVGQQPYGFWVRPELLLASGERPRDYTFPASTAFGSDWGKFSWAPEGPWLPTANISEGSNMLNWARSFSRRLEQGS